VAQREKRTRSSVCTKSSSERIKTQTVLPSADTAAALFWALIASSQINIRKVDGWQTLAARPVDQPIDLAG
jgi:putative transposase